MHPDSAKLFHKAFITDRLKSTQELLPLRNALWRWVGRAFRQPLESASAAIQVQVLRCEKLKVTDCDFVTLRACDCAPVTLCREEKIGAFNPKTAIFRACGA